jgi:hypothetical protein
MKLLSIALVNHDTNFSFYDNGDFKYHKLDCVVIGDKIYENKFWIRWI